MQYSKAQLRTLILKQRTQLSSAELSRAADGIAKRAQSSSLLVQHFKHAKHILSYAAFKGEVSPRPLINDLQATIYLPKIIDYDKCQMAFYPEDQTQIKNRYNIAEPRGDGKAMNIYDIDIVLVPLLAFDQHGNRIGMGAGYYDRALQMLSDRGKKPLLVGLAYDFQKVEAITADSWDRPLDVILTDEKIIDPTGVLLDKH